MARKTDIWMPWYIMDYQRDTGELTLEEDGFYRRALDQCWIRKGGIPTDATRIRALLRVSPAQFSRCKWVLDRFLYVRDSEYRSARLDIEIENANQRAERAAENGRSGGRPRNPERTQKKPSGLAKPNPDHNPEKSSSPSPSSSFPSEKNEWFSNPDFAAAWKAWEKSRKLKAGEIQYKALEKLATGSIDTAIAILNQSIENQYRGIFPLKGTANGTTRLSKSDRLDADAADFRRQLEGAGG